MSWLLQKHRREILQNINLTLREMNFYERLMYDAQEHKNRLCAEINCLENDDSTLNTIEKEAIGCRLELVHDFLLKRSCDPMVLQCMAIVNYRAHTQGSSDHNALEINIEDSSKQVIVTLWIYSLQTEHVIQKVLGLYDSCQDQPSQYCCPGTDEQHKCQKHYKTLSYQSGLRLQDYLQLKQISETLYNEQKNDEISSS